METESLISELVGEFYPQAVPLGHGRLRRTWIARTSSTLPPERELVELERMLEKDALRSIMAAYSESADAETLVGMRPAVKLVRLDDDHLIVRIESASHEKTVGDAAMISQWGVLQALDRQLRLEELQGLPCVHWFPLRARRESECDPPVRGGGSMLALESIKRDGPNRYQVVLNHSTRSFQFVVEPGEIEVVTCRDLAEYLHQNLGPASPLFAAVLAFHKAQQMNIPGD